MTTPYKAKGLTHLFSFSLIFFFFIIILSFNVNADTQTWKTYALYSNYSCSGTCNSPVYPDDITTFLFDDVITTGSHIYTYQINDGYNYGFNITLNQTVTFYNLSQIKLYIADDPRKRGYPEKFKFRLCNNNDCSLFESEWTELGYYMGWDCYSTSGYNWKAFNLNISYTIENVNKISLLFDTLDYGCTGIGYPQYAHGMSILEVNISSSIESTEFNNLPVATFIDQESSYCLNKTNPYYSFNFEISDQEDNTVYYYTTWNNDLEDELLEEKMLEDFSDDDYNLYQEGWFVSSNNCNYTTDNNQLNLLVGCDQEDLVYTFDNTGYTTDYFIEFDHYEFINDSVDICIMNNLYEKLACFRSESYEDTVNYRLYINLSYYNGSSYIFYDELDYYDILTTRIYVNDTYVSFCTNGNDRTFLSGCETEYTTIKYGTENNISKKLYFSPFYGFYGYPGQEFIMIDDIKIVPTEVNINWINYGLSEFTLTEFQTFYKEDVYLYDIYLTDNVNEPNYRKQSFLIAVQGICNSEEYLENQDYFSENASDFESVSGQGVEYLESIDNGKYKFNYMFYLIMFIVFLLILFKLGNLEFSLILTGFLFALAAWVITKNWTQIITSLTLLGLGVTIIVLRFI